MPRIDAFLELVVQQRASDLHFHAGQPPIIRHRGGLIPIPFRELSEHETFRFLKEIMPEDRLAEFQDEQEVDFVYALPGKGRFRVNVFRQSRGIGSVFRVIPEKLPTLSGLKFPLSVRRFTQQQNGLVLVTGPTGSGKTTTLAAMVHEINCTSRKHIITVEDPVEFVHSPINSTITQRQVGIHVGSFAEALRSAMREAPDVIVIGEMRDQETISLALTAAETGALVFGTLHTNSAARSVDRVIDAMPEGSREQTRSALSVLLRGVIAQQLCRSTDGESRMAALEILFQNHAVSHLIREGKTFQIEGYLRSVNPYETGMQSLEWCVTQMLAADLIEEEDAYRIVSYPDEVRKAVDRLRAQEDAA